MLADGTWTKLEVKVHFVSPASFPLGGPSDMGEGGTVPKRRHHSYGFPARGSQESNGSASVGSSPHLRESNVPGHPALGLWGHLLQPHAEGNTFSELGEQQLSSSQVSSYPEKSREFFTFSACDLYVTFSVVLCRTGSFSRGTLTCTWMWRTYWRCFKVKSQRRICLSGTLSFMPNPFADVAPSITCRSSCMGGVCTQTTLEEAGLWCRGTRLGDWALRVNRCFKAGKRSWSIFVRFRIPWSTIVSLRPLGGAVPHWWCLSGNVPPADRRQTVTPPGLPDLWDSPAVGGAPPSDVQPLFLQRTHGGPQPQRPADLAHVEPPARPRPELPQPEQPDVLGLQVEGEDGGGVGLRRQAGVRHALRTGGRDLQELQPIQNGGAHAGSVADWKTGWRVHSWVLWEFIQILADQLGGN